jgi:hypothetical protein
VPSGAETRDLQVDTSRALVPGTPYRLWLAFSKPMRWRDPGGSIASFPGQRVAAVPRVALEAPALGTEQLLSGTADAWLATPNTRPPGQAPDGYARYRDDALALSFELESGLGITEATSLLISVDGEDLSRQRIDADPATAVDWQDGAWSGLEDAAGLAGDSGGADCTLRPYASPNASDPAPTAAGACRAAGDNPPAGLAPLPASLLPPRTCITPNSLPQTPAPPPPAPPRSGGGGHASWLLILALLIALTGAASGRPRRAGHASRA